MPSTTILQLHQVFLAAVNQYTFIIIGKFGHVAQHVHRLFLVGHVGHLDQFERAVFFHTFQKRHHFGQARGVVAVSRVQCRVADRESDTDLLPALLPEHLDASEQHEC